MDLSNYFISQLLQATVLSVIKMDIIIHRTNIQVRINNNKYPFIEWKVLYKSTIILSYSTPSPLLLTTKWDPGHWRLVTAQKHTVTRHLYSEWSLSSSYHVKPQQVWTNLRKNKLKLTVQDFYLDWWIRILKILFSW